MKYLQNFQKKLKIYDNLQYKSMDMLKLNNAL